MESVSDKWWSMATVAVVTGANKGLGYAIVKGLAEQGVTTILTARNEQRGREAVDSLKQKSGLSVHFHELDVTSSSSVQQFAKWLKDEFGLLHILVNNAGISGAEPGFDAKFVFETNYYGVHRVTEALLPLMETAASTAGGARIINIGAGISRLDFLKNEPVRKKLSDVQNLSTGVIESIIQEYFDDLKDGKITEKGWNGAESYTASKTVLNAYTRMIARDLSKKRGSSKFFVNCVCPGVTSTDMNGRMGHSPEVGAQTVVWLALLPASMATTGSFFVKKKKFGFDSIPLYIEPGVFVLPPEEYEKCVADFVAKMRMGMRICASPSL